MAAEVDGTWVAAPQCPRRRLNGRQVLACPSGEAACLLAVDTCQAAMGARRALRALLQHRQMTRPAYCASELRPEQESVYQPAADQLLRMLSVCAA